MISVRPSVVGKWTSSIWTAASLSSTALGVRPGGQRLEPGAQRDVQAVGDDGDEAVRFDAVLKLMVDRLELQIILEILERGLDVPLTTPLISWRNSTYHRGSDFKR